MIPYGTFNLMIAATLLLFLYSLMDNRNHLYANVVLAIVSGISFAYLGEAVSIGAVDFTSGSLGSILKLFSGGAFIYAFLMGADILFESYNDFDAKQKAPGTEDEE